MFNRNVGVPITYDKKYIRTPLAISDGIQKLRLKICFPLLF